MFDAGFAFGMVSKADPWAQLMIPSIIFMASYDLRIVNRTNFAYKPKDVCGEVQPPFDTDLVILMVVFPASSIPQSFLLCYLRLLFHI